MGLAWFQTADKLEQHKPTPLPCIACTSLGEMESCSCYGEIRAGKGVEKTAGFGGIDVSLQL